MDYRHLEKTAMCYRCVYKELCKTVYQADDLGIQESKWNCPKFTEEKHQVGWIPVSEGLPEENVCDDGYHEPSKRVLVQTSNGQMYTTRYWSRDKKNVWTDLRYPEDIIAWQPLPEPFEQ